MSPHPNPPVFGFLWRWAHKRARRRAMNQAMEELSHEPDQLLDDMRIPRAQLNGFWAQNPWRSL